MDAFREITRARPGLACAFVFMSGGAFTPEARTFLDEVPNARLEKPFDLPDLRKAVNARISPVDAVAGMR